MEQTVKCERCDQVVGQVNGLCAQTLAHATLFAVYHAWLFPVSVAKDRRILVCKKCYSKSCPRIVLTQPTYVTKIIGVGK